MRCWVLAAAAIMATTQLAAEEGTPAFRQAANNLSHEFTECGAYFAIVAQCIRNRDNSDPVAANYEKSRDVAIERAYVLGREGGVMDEAVLARLDVASSQQLKKINTSCANISILYSTYGYACKALIEDPMAAFDRHLREAQAQGFK